MRVSNKNEYSAFLKHGGADYFQVSLAFSRSEFTVSAIGSDYHQGVFSNGCYEGGSVLNIAPGVLEMYETGQPGGALMLESTVKHELVHLFDDLDGEDMPYEEGTAFERDVFGADVDIGNAALLEKSCC